MGSGRTGTDRQFFFVNDRPCGLSKVSRPSLLCHTALSLGHPQVQKAFNDVYRSFNANQAPFIIANFIVPTGVYRQLPSIMTYTPHSNRDV